MSRRATVLSVMTGISMTTASAAQIVVGDANERRVHRELTDGWCYVSDRGTNYISGVVTMPRDDFQTIFYPAFKNHIRATYGHASDGFCDDDGGDESTMDTTIRANPDMVFVKTGWTGGFSRQVEKESRVTRSENRAPATVTSTPKGPTPNQLKYQRELAEYNARLAEIEKIKTDIASKHAADTAAAQQRLAQHEGDMARHRAQVAQANALQRQYEQDLAAHQAQVSSMETKKDREAKVDWKEAVVVCSLNPSDGQSKFGNWRCDGPLQMTYAKLGNPGQALDTGALVALSQACGGSREAVRDLGLVGSDRLFGCSFGIHPKSIGGIPYDTAAKHGVSYVPGRAIYHCPLYKSACRTQ